MAVLQNGTTQVLPTRNYNAGTTNVPAQELQIGQSKINIAMDRNNWPDNGGNVVECRFDISYDNGATKQLLAGFGCAGGNIVNPWTNQVQAQSSVELAIPQPENPNRQITAIVTVYVRINTAVYVTVS